MLNALFVGAVITGQLEADPRENLALRPGEIVRYHRTGGRTRDGGADDKVVVTGTKIFVKTKRYSNTIMQTGAWRGELQRLIGKEALATLIKAPTKTKMWPSTYDGTDNVLRVARQGRPFAWNNRDFEAPEGPSLLTYLDQLLIPPQ